MAARPALGRLPIYRQTEADLIRNLQNPQIRYLDYFTGDYDHVAHLTADPVSQLHTLEKLDALVGRIWNAIAASPLAAHTALVLVSDHGMNTSETVFSQGFNFVDWFNSPAGGAHHVLTNRHPLTEFKLKGLDPFVSEVITPSPDSNYLAGQSDQYPTVMLDLDGNERASIGLRNNTFNVVQILLDQLIQKGLPGPVRNAALSRTFSRRWTRFAAEWRRDLDDLSRELTALDGRIDAQQKTVDAQPRKKKWTKQQVSLGLDKDARREAVRLDILARGAQGLLGLRRDHLAPTDLTPADFDPGRFKMTELIPPKSLGPLNSLWDLRHYVIGRAPGGLVVRADGSLDWDRSFHTVDYFTALRSISVRNNVQAGVAPKPVDFIAVRRFVPRIAIAVLVWRDDAHQALILARGGELRYQPVNANLEPVRGGRACRWSTSKILNSNIAASDRHTWLNQWHDERSWLEAVHRTRYSNGIIGLTEELLDPPHPGRLRPLPTAQARSAPHGFAAARQRPLEFQRARLQPRREPRIIFSYIDALGPALRRRQGYRHSGGPARRDSLRQPELRPDDLEVDGPPGAGSAGAGDSGAGAEVLLFGVYRQDDVKPSEKQLQVSFRVWTRVEANSSLRGRPCGYSQVDNARCVLFESNIRGEQTE